MRRPMPIDAATGEEVEAVVRRIVATPAPIVDKTKDAMGVRGGKLD